MENSAQSLKRIQKTLVLADLTNDQINRLTTNLNPKFKYARLFELIARNQGVLTHQLLNTVYTNNVPNTVKSINNKIMNLGYVCLCSTNHKGSEAWHVYEMPTAVIDTRSAANDGEVK